MPVSLRRKYRLFETILKRMGPSTDPCGTYLTISAQQLYQSSANKCR